MTDNNKDRTEVFEPQSESAAREHAKRASRRIKIRNKAVSKTTRYTVSVLAVIFVFLLAFLIGSLLIKLIFSGSSKNDETAEDSTSSLMISLKKYEAEIDELNTEIEYLQNQVNRYNELYGPLPAESSASTPPSDSSTEAFMDTSDVPEPEPVYDPDAEPEPEEVQEAEPEEETVTETESEQETSAATESEPESEPEAASQETEE